MTFSRLSPFLRRALLADAVITGATGLLMFLGAGFLAALLELPEALVRYAGLVLLPFVAYVATCERLRHLEVWAVIVINALWVAASIALLLSGWVASNALGVAFVLIPGFGGRCLRLATIPRRAQGRFGVKGASWIRRNSRA